MNKLLQKVRISNKKDDLIKKAITTHLSNSVKEIQYMGIEEQKTNKTGDLNESYNQLCISIEAMFLQGLKDTITHRFKRVIADVDERPEPSFWAPLLVISHRQIIDQITNLSQITTEVGQCRAWVRFALNDCLLSSYLMIIRQDSSALKSFYNTGAYIRDSDLLDVAQRLIEGVETFKTFTLPCNSSLLNTWSFPSLFLAGIWAPTLKSCPVAPCDDVAQSLDEFKAPLQDVSSDTASLCSAVSFSSESSGLRQIFALNEDEVLKIILSKDKDKYPANTSSSYDEKSFISSEFENKTLEDNIAFSSVGNSLNRTGWSFDRNQEQDAKLDDVPEQSTSEIQPHTQPKSMEASFSALIDSYNSDANISKSPDLRKIWQKFEDTRTEGSGLIHSYINGVEGQELPVASPVKQESTSLVAQIGKIGREKGLDNQSYECAGCSQVLVTTPRPKICGFTGQYYCDSCMSEDKIQIPARIIHNWDFKLYSVSKKSFAYISEIKDHPVIDFKILNPYIYGAVEEMAHIQVLRNQLNFLRAYLYTCREPVIEELQKKMWPREYMYEHIHQYSLSDLLEVPCKTLLNYLEAGVNFGKEHVFNCWLCSQKGFVCEICNKPKVLFPFDVDNIYRCETCNAVYHKDCLNSSIPCPKCERRKKRVDLPFLEAVKND